MATKVYGNQEYADFPLASSESASNTASVSISVDDRSAHKWQLTTVVSTGTALDGTLAVLVKPVDVGEYQSVAGTVDFTALKPQIFEGKFDSVKTIPNNLTAGCKYTNYIDILE